MSRCGLEVVSWGCLADKDSLRLGGGLIRSDERDGLRAVKLRRGEVRSYSTLRPLRAGELGGKTNGAPFGARFLRSYSRPTSFALYGANVGQGGNAGDMKLPSMFTDALRLSSRIELSAVSRLTDEYRNESAFDKRKRFGGYAQGGGGTGWSGAVPAVWDVMLPPRVLDLVGS